MNTKEIPFTFVCQGAPLIGIIHLPEQPSHRGVLTIVPGGPQYRAGVGRQLLYMARNLAEKGIPVMRFDHRGLGDGGGEYRGFQHIGDDINAAIDAFMEKVPALNEIILWGGCDAASAAFLHGPSNAKVSGMILGNPWVHNENTHAKAARSYYLKRIKDKAFWLKLFKMRLNPFQALYSAVKTQNTGQQNHTQNKQEKPYQQRMRDEAQNFKGRILLLMSGQSIFSREFDELIAASPQWSEAINRPGVTRVDFREANQNFSNLDAREKLINTAAEWLEDWQKENELPSTKT